MEYTIKSRIWIESQDRVFLGEGRVRLLKAISKQGSLSKAASSLDMSYKKAWNLLDSMNKTAKQPLVITATGGKGGGGAKLTEYGEKVIDTFESINKRCWEFLDKELKQVSI
ncbi:LysR family transcriptional regulator [Aquimarina sp. AD10]|uniref:winged helix-turn-helix domain-containing protein n=1 Tax=Aquimarina sp. AD10 TaxID=1714849 RepID=UPI000E4FE3BF|nr:LysR family transcriptional regulator [Aquimarina sp. AD10]AXT62342.1 LysR family transcriptional regulator [Aquimarina sp. AD10]RKM90462.1 LysR family transcriptional regulator [Aquimarina sp. AD10]